MMKKTIPQGEKSRPARPSFYEVLANVEKQVELEWFSQADRRQAREICLIITEVLKLNPEGEIRIEGAMLPTEMVQDVYRQLTRDHVEMVMDKFRSIGQPLKSTRAYLRTMLYNAFFEIESYYINLYASDDLIQATKGGTHDP